MNRRRQTNMPPLWRKHVVIGLLLVGFSMLVARVVQIQTKQQEYLQTQGDARYLRDLTVKPQRGKILDRNSRILALSTPVESVWAEPGIFCAAKSHWESLLQQLSIRRDQLLLACNKRADADFMYVQRRLSPHAAEAVMALGVPGISLQREYKRFYPGGPVAAHIVGFTDIDDRGQEGLEYQFNNQLEGIPGRQRVLKDLAGHYIESVESVRQVKHGQDLKISIDERLQYLASGYLEAAVKQHKARAGSIVVLSVPSGEILALVNSPQFNPNDRSSLKQGVFRNRTVTDTFEPGSTVKPFTIAMALESGEIDSTTVVDTAPGFYRIGNHTIRDFRNYGAISVEDVIVHSSNIGTTKIALTFPFDQLFNSFKNAGFGVVSSKALPGEVSGHLIRRKRPIEHATLAYGYGLSATALQLARAYTVFTNGGQVLETTLIPQKEGYQATGKRLFSAKTAAKMRLILERVTSPSGTASQARVARYRVAGKTGTTHKLINGSYNNSRYYSLFAGFIPVSKPRFVSVVVIDDPRGEKHFGGDVAAPVFSQLMHDAVRIYNVPPDLVPDSETVTAPSAGNTT